jgi:hypothetical protein
MVQQDTAWELDGGMTEKVDFAYAPGIANDSRFTRNCWLTGAWQLRGSQVVS